MKPSSKRTEKTREQIRRVVIYTRVSTKEQADSGLSMSAQAEAIGKYAADKGQEVVKTFEEKGASGRDENRKEFRRMIEFVFASHNKIDAILVYQTSRFGRDATHARATKTALRRHGIQVIAICQETSDDPTGRLIEGLFELIDQYESEINGMRTMAAMRQNARDGYLNGSKAPFGFMTEQIEVGKATRRKLVINPAEVDPLRETFRIYVQGKGSLGTARELNRRGILHRGRVWSKNRVLKVIEEGACVGTYVWGKYDSRTGLLNDKEDRIEILCEAILDRETFDVAQRLRSDREPMQNPDHAVSSPLLLAGLLRCGKCGSRYSLQSSGKRGPQGDYKYRYYACRRSLREGKEQCDAQAYPQEVIEKTVLEHLAQRIFTDETCKEILKKVCEESGGLRQRVDEERRQLERQLADTEKKLGRWYEAFESGEVTEDAGKERLAVLKADRSRLVETLSKLVPLKQVPPHLYRDETIWKFQASLRQLFASGDEGLAKHYMRFLVDRIEVNGTRVEIKAKPNAAVALMAKAAGGSTGVLTATDAVLTHG